VKKNRWPKRKLSASVRGMGLWSRKKKKKGAARAEAENAAGNMVAWPDATQPARMSPQAPPGATTQRGNASGAKRLTQAAPSAAATRPSPVSPASASIFAASLPAPLRDIKPTMAANAAELKPSRAPGEDLAERFATRHPPVRRFETLQGKGRVWLGLRVPGMRPLSNGGSPLCK
jgi:hypothetical protein